MSIPKDVLKALLKRAQAASRKPLKPSVEVHPDYLCELLWFYDNGTVEQIKENLAALEEQSNNNEGLFSEPVKKSLSDSIRLKEVGLVNADPLDLAVRSNAKPVAELAQFYIDSYWYLQHPDKKMLKSPEEVMNFLQDLAREKFMWDDLNSSMRSYLSLVSQAYRHTRNRQLAIVAQMRNEGKSIDEICDELRKYLRTDEDHEEFGF